MAWVDIRTEKSSLIDFFRRMSLTLAKGCPRQRLYSAVKQRGREKKGPPSSSGPFFCFSEGMVGMSRDWSRDESTKNARKLGAGVISRSQKDLEWQCSNEHSHEQFGLVRQPVGFL